MVDKLPATACPNCQSRDTVCLESISRRAWVDYHRCLKCQHTWSTPRPTGQPVCDGQTPGVPRA